MKLHKLILLLSFNMLFTSIVFGQAAVDIPLIATDGITTQPMAVGLDLNATNGIDPLLGESELPPIPPTNVLEIRFDLGPYTGHPWSTYADYRAPGNPPVFPFTGMIEHTLWWFNYSSSNMYIDINYSLPPGALMTITDQIGGSFLNLGPFSGQGTATIPGTYTNIFSKALLKMQYDNIIPVELTSFTASVLQNEKAIQLNWTTATETNNSGFEIERASSGTSPGQAIWNTLGFVLGFGTTTEPKSYSFTDEKVTTGTYKYRLKQIDFDGSFEYSNEIEVEVDFTPKEFVLYQNYPNPFNPVTTIKFTVPSVIAIRQLRGKQSQLVTLKVYDVLGNEVATLVNEEKQPGAYEVQFDAFSLASGMYLYKLQVGNPSTGSGQGFVQTMKMILTK